LPDVGADTTYDARVREAREGRPVVLWLLVALLTAACVVGGVQVVHAHGSRERSAAQQERYADAVAAAETVATAFVNIRHDRAEEDLARIADHSTGPLKDRYVDDAERLLKAFKRERTITTGEVVWAGVVRVSASGATVLVATHGTRADRSTDGEPVSRDLRLRLQLVPVDGTWLTSDIQQVD
jgi:Mce-associated membrane protein